MSDDDLYLRGAQTLVASWQAYARGATGAELRLLPGVAVAVFPHQPERGVYNNALLDRDLGDTSRATALDAIESTYAAAQVTHFAVWAHETDLPLRRALEHRGYTVDTSTRAMGTPLDDLEVPRPSIRLEPATWDEYLRAEGLPPTFLAGSEHAAFHVLVARVDGKIVGSALAYDHDGDCGIYNVSTSEQFRRRGLGSALTVAQLNEAQARGGRTASLQSSAMAERVYAAVGFRDLGRILEYVPAILSRLRHAYSTPVRCHQWGRDPTPQLARSAA